MELIKHECGVAMIRLLKPLDYYKEKYGSTFYGLYKLYLIMEKEHNRGQEGAGVGCVKIDAHPGNEYIFRERAQGPDAIREVFASIGNIVKEAIKEGDGIYGQTLPFEGEVYMGHLRYSTTGRSGLSYVHPFMRRNNWSSRNLLLCGNFNMTNVDEIFEKIISTGQHPRLYADTFLLLEQLGHSLDRENERLYKVHFEKGLRGLELSASIARDLDVKNILYKCAPSWDGGYVICGIVGNGDMWAMRDPKGIRPAFYYMDEEVVVVASERPVIQTAFDLQTDDVHELLPGQAIVIDRDGSSEIVRILPEGENSRCSFERIYFSRGSDKDIYEERKQLGKNLVPQVLKSINYDIDRSVISFIPNTAEVAFYGLVEGIEEHLISSKIKEINRLASIGALDDRNIRNILSHRVRKEKVAIKDIKLRTFIAEGNTRRDLAAHVYDITYGSINPGDYLVAIDDSIVRGTTLKESILRILDRLHPGKLIIVSSSPQVRFPDCYGIDMSRMDEFIAFKAAMELLKERGMSYVIDTVYRNCKQQENAPKEKVKNYVKEIYSPFSDEEISSKIAEMLRSDGVDTPIEIVYQTVENMHKAIPGHPGDWYFTGDYPTPGGNRLVNKAFINYYEGRRNDR